MSCSLCPSESTSYRDRSQCVTCGSTTTGLDPTTGDCGCSSAMMMLYETDVAGTKLSSKQCEACPVGTAVVTSSQYIAGMYYKADRYSCQSCPDQNMQMSVSSTGVYSCVCGASYQLVGVSGIGPQSCVLITNTQSFLSQTSAAYRMTYLSGSVVENSLTIQHYYLQAASQCQFFGSPDDVRYCQQLANLCVLQLYADSAIPCINHQTIIKLRGTLSQVRGITNWAYGQPWLYFGGTDATAVCTSNIYLIKKKFDSVLKYMLGVYTMNGTFIGWKPLEAGLSYCTNGAPYTSHGGGESAATDWQIVGYSRDYSFRCELQPLLQREQLFYELFLYGQNANNAYYVPVPVRITNIAENGMIFYAML